jgi:hypothetical protein
MGSVFALAQDAQTGMRLTFAAAAVLLGAGLAIALGWSDQSRHAQDAAAREQP